MTASTGWLKGRCRLRAAVARSAPAGGGRGASIAHTRPTGRSVFTDEHRLHYFTRRLWAGAPVRRRGFWVVLAAGEHRRHGANSSGRSSPRPAERAEKPKAEKAEGRRRSRAPLPPFVHPRPAKRMEPSAIVVPVAVVPGRGRDRGGRGVVAAAVTTAARITDIDDAGRVGSTETIRSRPSDPRRGRRRGRRAIRTRDLVVIGPEAWRG